MQIQSYIHNDKVFYCKRLLPPKFSANFIPYSGFFYGWKFSLFNFLWVDILAFGATLHRICIVEEILVELILAF